MSCQIGPIGLHLGGFAGPVRLDGGRRAKFWDEVRDKFPPTASADRRAQPQQRSARRQMLSSAFGAAKQTSPPVSPRSFHSPDPRRVNRSGWSWKPSSRSLNDASAYDLA